MPHILINALSMGSGGGFTVGRELLHHLAALRPDWKFTFAIIAAHPLHQQIKQDALPTNIEVLEAPANATAHRERSAWEKSELTRWAETHGVSAVVQLNGMLVPGMKPPTLCHMQDPWPYRPQAWSGLRSRMVAFLKRRQHRNSLEHAAAFGWTSDYLRQLICTHHGIWPTRSQTLYNGVAQEWIDRVRGELKPLDARPMEIVTVSNVNFYKRQSLIIRTLPLLVAKPGLSELHYRIVGAIDSPNLQQELEALAQSLGVGARVIFEGRVSNQRIADAFTSARAFVLMSVCESFGIPAVEAMSFGTPVVTADCCAMPEVCGDAAELATPDDVQSTADAIARVLLDRAHAEQLRRRGIERVGHFTWDSVAEKMATMLSQIESSSGTV